MCLLLLLRKNKGAMLLRIEDTDQQRYVRTDTLNSCRLGVSSEVDCSNEGVTREGKGRRGQAKFSRSFSTWDEKLLSALSGRHGRVTCDGEGLTRAPGNIASFSLYASRHATCHRRLSPLPPVALVLVVLPGRATLELQVPHR